MKVCKKNHEITKSRNNMRDFFYGHLQKIYKKIWMITLFYVTL